MISWGTALFVLAALTTVCAFMNEKNKDAEQLKQKDEIIAQLKGLATGGDSYIFLKPTLLKDQDEVRIDFEFRGKFPLYDVKIDVYQYDLEPIVGEPRQFQFKKSNERSVTLGTMNPLRKYIQMFENIPVQKDLSGQWGRHYFYSISTRNNLIEEDIFLRKEGSTFSMAYRASTTEPDYGDSSPNALKMKKAQARIRHIDPMFPVQILTFLKGDAGWLAKPDESSGVGIVLPDGTKSE